jgi:hypothetical protein
MAGRYIRLLCPRHKRTGRQLYRMNALQHWLLERAISNCRDCGEGYVQSCGQAWTRRNGDTCQCLREPRHRGGCVCARRGDAVPGGRARRGLRLARAARRD